MGKPAAKFNDSIVAEDTHIVLVSTPTGPVPTPLPNPFNGFIDGNLSVNVKIMGKPAAMVGSTARNIPPHIPEGGPFEIPPSNEATIITGSIRVKINGKAATRLGDTAMTCNDPVDLPIGKIIAAGNVLIGD